MSQHIDPIYGGWPPVWRTEDGGYEIIAKLLPLRYLKRHLATANCSPDFPALVIYPLWFTFLGLLAIYPLTYLVELKEFNPYNAPWFFNGWMAFALAAGLAVMYYRLRLFYWTFLKTCSFRFSGNKLTVSSGKWSRSFLLDTPHGFEMARHHLAEQEELLNRNLPHKDNYTYRESYELFYIDGATNARLLIVEVCGSQDASALYNRLRQIDKLYVSGKEPDANEPDQEFLGDYETDLIHARRLFDLPEKVNCTELSRRHAELSRITAPANYGSQALLDKVNAAYAILKRGYGCD